MSLQVTNREAAEKLRQYAADRDALQSRLASSYLEIEPIRAAWLYGSFGRGEADDLSDVDTWLAVSEASLMDMPQILANNCGRFGNVIAVQTVPHNAPPGGGFMWVTYQSQNGPIVFDYSWQPVSVDLTCPEPRLNIFDRRDKVAEAYQLPTTWPVIPIPTRGDSLEEQVVQRLNFVWLMLQVTLKYLTRDPASNMTVLPYAKPSFEEVAEMLQVPEVTAQTSWQTDGDIELKLGVLQQIIENASLLTSQAISKGIAISPSTGACLSNLLATVEATLTNQNTIS